MNIENHILRHVFKDVGDVSIVVNGNVRHHDKHVVDTDKA